MKIVRNWDYPSFILQVYIFILFLWNLIQKKTFHVENVSKLLFVQYTLYMK